MAKNSLFGPGHIGRWVRLDLVSSDPVVCQIVQIGHQMVEVREKNGEGTWHIPDRSIVRYSWVACPADVAEVLV